MNYYDFNRTPYARVGLSDVLGLLPMFLDLNDPRPAKEQINENYAHGGGWQPQDNYTLNTHTSDDPCHWALKYPGDPEFHALAFVKFHDETIVMFEHEIVAIVQKDGSFEACRLD